MDFPDPHMTQPDLFAWNMERDPAMRSTIISVLILDSEPDQDCLIRTLERAARVVPRLRHVLSTAPLALTPPRWVPDPDFDLSWHVRRFGLPPPADMSTVLEFARQECMEAFDPVRPLWRFTVLTGLSGGQAAVVLKIHHSLTDGVGGILIAEQVLDSTREGSTRAPADEPEQHLRGTLADVVAWNSAAGLGLLRHSVIAAGSLLRRTMTDPVGLVRGGGALTRSLARLTRPVISTLSPVMTARSTGRALAVLEVPLDELTAAARRAGCTVNDAYLTAVLIGVREYHRHHDATVGHLRLTMPINVRSPDDPMGGNRVTLARFAVPVDIDEVDELMRAVHAVAGRWRDEPSIGWSGTVAGVLNQLPTAVIAGMLEHVDFVASNVPGSPIPLYLAGAQVEQIYAFGPTLGTAFNTLLLSHVGTYFLGIVVDSAAVPDLPVFAESIASGFDSTLGAGGDTRSRSRVVVGSLSTRKSG